MKTNRHWTVQVYKDDGTHVGSAKLDAEYDHVDCFPVNTRKLAEEYAKRYLVSEGQYAIVT